MMSRRMQLLLSVALSSSLGVVVTPVVELLVVVDRSSGSPENKLASTSFKKQCYNVQLFR
jgi:hypothetical protein